ncbi:MAG: 50S ribosomal protein L1 [Acidilobus sp.]
MPVSTERLVDAIKKAISVSKGTKFDQSVELIVTLRDFDPKGPEGRFREVVFLPHKPPKEPAICVVAGGDLLLEAKKLGVNAISREDLQAMRGDKKKVKSVGRQCDWVLVSADLMGQVGSVLGPALGPRGKVPIAIPPRAALAELVENYKRATWVRVRGQPQIMTRIGTASMGVSEVAENASAVLNVIESRMGAPKINTVYVKTTMGVPVQVQMR